MENQNFIGKKYTTNQGYEVEVIEFFSKKNCTIRFDSGFKMYNKIHFNVVHGKIKNPYHPNICGIGFIGVGEYSCKANELAYKKWQAMIERCYDEKYLSRKPSYKEFSVCKNWHNFQNFAKWFEGNYNHQTMVGWHLDKDLFNDGSNVYSENTCCLIPQEINNMFRKNKTNSIVKVRKRFQVRIYFDNKNKRFGSFKTLELAEEKVEKIKNENKIKLANKWKSLISEKVYLHLTKYNLPLTDNGEIYFNLKN